jgi:hypothetical protein
LEGTLSQSSHEMPGAAAFERALRRELDEARAREIVHRARERYGVLYAERERYSNRALRQHLEENILPGVALYQTLLDAEDIRELVMPLVEAAFEEWAVANRQRMERLGRLPVFYRLLRALARPMMWLNFPEPGWTTEWVEISGERISFHMRSCFYLEVLEGYGVPELTAQYCRMDDLIYEEVSPYVRWARTPTLGRGDECCDFRFERVRRA